MKKILCLALAAFTLVSHADFSAWNGTLTIGQSAHPILVRIDATEAGQITRICVDQQFCLSGKWTESRAVRNFTVLTSSNQFVGVIRRGVVTGTYENYLSGQKGTFRCEPQ